MRRHFYLSDDLDDLERLEHDLEARGIERAQVHILSHNDAGLESHHLHQVESLLRKDVVRSGKIGFMVGIVAAAIPLLVAYVLGLSEPYFWVPVVFLSIILLGFCTWEGGLIGIHRPNRQFEKFERALNSGHHLLIVDVSPRENARLQEVIAQHPGCEDMGASETVPDWQVGMQKQWGKFIRWAP